MKTLTLATALAFATIVGAPLHAAHAQTWLEVGTGFLEESTSPTDAGTIKRNSDSHYVEFGVRTEDMPFWASVTYYTPKFKASGKNAKGKSVTFEEDRLFLFSTGVEIPANEENPWNPYIGATFNEDTFGITTGIRYRLPFGLETGIRHVLAHTDRKGRLDSDMSSIKAIKATKSTTSWSYLGISLSYSLQ